jgi:hypothetical protein
MKDIRFSMNPGVMMQASNSSTREGEAGESKAHSQPELYCKFKAILDYE